ncbi:unnamed protein product [Vicia faba]|uniref:Sodium/calcium exchanger membrane region domain-containing protein n=1 Tax=Vicia faba TaxID=3906 RepID=A0AAV1ATF5_VICFA|nr:unnamed protein product [Vicia faba]
MNGQNVVTMKILVVLTLWMLLGPRKTSKRFHLLKVENFFWHKGWYEEERRQADVNSLMLILALLCLLLPMLFTYSAASPELTVESSLYLSRAASIVMLAAYFVYLIFQLWTHRQLFEAEDEGGDENIEAEEAVIGFWSGFAWLAGMTVFTALLSEYVVDTIEDASDSWGLSVSFLSIILLPVVGNAAEHAGAIIFAFKNKLVRIYIIVLLNSILNPFI